VEHALSGVETMEARVRAHERPSRSNAWWMAALLGLAAATAAQAADVPTTRWPSLRAVHATQSARAVQQGREAISGTPTSTPLSTSERAALTDDLAIERALWEDELARAEEKLRAGGAGEGITRLLDVRSKVESGFQALEAALARPEGPSLQLLSTLLSAGEGAGTTPDWPILSGRNTLVAQLPEPVRIEPTFAPAPLVEHDAAPGSTSRDDATFAAAAAIDEATDLLYEPIRTKAESLGNDPIAIYLFVLNSIRAEHYFGSIKPPEIVLSSSSGNDADQAALLAALLRAAGQYARIAWGVQRVPTKALESHFGVAGYSAVEQVMTSAGIPWSAVVVGGRPIAYTIDRVWCEVWLPFANYRGVALDQTGATWVPLDPEIKTMPTFGARRILDEIGIGAAALRGQYLQGQYCQADLTQPNACPSLRDVLTQKINDYLVSQSDSSTYDDLASPLASIEQQECVLPTSPVGAILATNGWGMSVPERLQHRLHIVATSGAHTLLDATVAINELSGREGVIWYEPATPADQEIVAAYADYLWDVPPYLVNATPTIMAGTQELARGTEGLGMGQRYDLTITVTAPSGRSVTFTNGATIGVPIGLGATAGKEAWTPPDGEPVNTVEFYAQLLSTYSDGVATLEGELAKLHGVTVVRPLPNVVSVGSVVDTVGTMGVVQSFEWKGVYIDADLWGGRVEGGGSAKLKEWLILTQLEASILERLLFESYDVTSVSADKVIVLALRGGVSLVEVTAANIESTLPTLPYQDSIKDEIRAWVQQGGSALIPATPITHINWTGVGYILFDPQTGHSRYQLAGAISGGMTAVPAQLNPLKKYLQVPTNAKINPYAASATRIQIVDGDLQDGEVGQVLAKQLIVGVTDSKKRMVQNAMVKMSVTAGGAQLSCGGGAYAAQVELPTTGNGRVLCNLKLGTSTADNPYYIKLDPKHDEWGTQISLAVVNASVYGHELLRPFYLKGKPGPLDHLEAVAEGLTQSWLANLSLPKAFVAVPSDQYKNPVSNVPITFALDPNVPPPASLAEGPVILKPEQDGCKQGWIVGQECGGAAQAVVTGGWTGVWVRFVMGPGQQGQDTTYETTASAPGLSDDKKVKFTAVTGWWVGGDQGLPAVIVAGRGQPVNGKSEVIEAYPVAGANAWKDVYPLKASIIIVQQKYEVKQDAEGHHYIHPLGKYVTRRLLPPESAACSGTMFGETSCGKRAGEGGRVVFGSTSGDTPVQLDANGVAVYLPPRPASPGLQTYQVTAYATVGVPKYRDLPDNKKEVVPCSTGINCGAELEYEEFPKPDTETYNRTTLELWGVSATVATPVPLVPLTNNKKHGLGKKPKYSIDGKLPFRYTVLPDIFPADRTSLVFLEKGQEVAFASAPGLGEGVGMLGPGSFFTEPGATGRSVRVDVNRGHWWLPATGEQPRFLHISSDEVTLEVMEEEADFRRALAEQVPDFTVTTQASVTGNVFGFDDMDTDDRDDDRISVGGKDKTLARLLLGTFPAPNDVEVYPEPDDGRVKVSKSCTGTTCDVTIEGGEPSSDREGGKPATLCARYLTPEGPVLAKLNALQYRRMDFKSDYVLVHDPSSPKTAIAATNPKVPSSAEILTFGSSVLKYAAVGMAEVRAPILLGVAFEVLKDGEIDYFQNPGACGPQDEYRKLIRNLPAAAAAAGITLDSQDIILINAKIMACECRGGNRHRTGTTIGGFSADFNTARPAVVGVLQEKAKTKWAISHELGHERDLDDVNEAENLMIWQVPSPIPIPKLPLAFRLVESVETGTGASKSPKEFQSQWEETLRLVWVP
jgi:hypothetical protein